MITRESTISNDKAGARLNYGVHHTNEAKKRMKNFLSLMFHIFLLMTYAAINAKNRGLVIAILPRVFYNTCFRQFARKEETYIFEILFLTLTTKCHCCALAS